MSFKLTHPLPEKCMVAVSGGVDSMSAFHFLRQVEGRVARVVHVHHNTGDFADEAEDLVREVCEKTQTPLTVRKVREHAGEGDSREAFWRDQRYRFFWDAHVIERIPIILAHNMDDCLEEYAMCTMVRGFYGTIPYRHSDCIRPFRLWKRPDIIEYARKHDVRWVEDPSNKGHEFLRGRIRGLLIPRIKFINPGVYKIVERVIHDQDRHDGEPEKADRGT